MPIGLMILIGLLLSPVVSAQAVITVRAGGFAVGVGALILPRFQLTTEPTSPPLPQKFAGGFAASIVDPSRGIMTAHRFLHEDSMHIFLGYDLLIEPQPQADTYRVSFFELGLGALDMARSLQNQPFNPAEWKKLPLPGYPTPQVVHIGDRLSVELMVNTDTGQKLVDNIIMQGQPVLPPRPLARPAPTVPTVTGVARDFSAEDAEMRIVQPRITMNGTPQDTASRGAANAAGTLVWFHIPSRGRYILSLAPRPELGFVKAGEVRGGAITFTLGPDTFTLESTTPITTGYAPYILYVLHDPDWEPTAQAQRGHFQTGSVSPGEIALLRRK